VKRRFALDMQADPDIHREYLAFVDRFQSVTERSSVSDRDYNRAASKKSKWDSGAPRMPARRMRYHGDPFGAPRAPPPRTEPRMAETLDPLVLDFVAWVAAAPRPYREAIEAWRTSCPRLAVWEDAIDRNLVAQRRDGVCGRLVAVTTAGRRFLREHGRA
jgi:hypothetical protein